MHWFGFGPAGWMVGMMAVTMVTFWAVAVLGIIALVRHVLGSGSAQETTPTGSAAEALLAARFARGEIDAAEYQQGLDVLRGADDRRAAGGS
ncbi:MAG: hypothetical protein GEV07_06830 [Streptosporangiales bacterium]|nr:hypothetical protein [Streptosporangiales bacterium]